MALLLQVLERTPTSWIRAASTVRSRSRLVRRISDWLPDMVRNCDGRIQKGLGRGLRFNGGNSAVGFLLGTQDLEVQFALHYLLTPGMIVCDIGANVGFTALLAAKQVGPTGRVFCYEALADNARRIQHNAALNGFKTIRVRQVVLGAADGETEFHCPDAASWVRLGDAGGRPATANSLKVDVRSLDSLIATADLPLPRFIKVDVNGSEASVLKGAKKLLGSARPILVIKLHGTYTEVARALKGLRYTVRLLTANVTSIDGEFQVLAYPRENTELNDRWTEIASEKWAWE